MTIYGVPASELDITRRQDGTATLLRESRIHHLKFSTLTTSVFERAGVSALMSCSSTTVLTTGPTSLRPEERLLFPVEVRRSSKGNFCCCISEAGCDATEVNLEKLLQSVKSLLEDYLRDLKEEKLPFPTPLDKAPVKDEGFVSMEVVEVLLP